VAPDYICLALYAFRGAAIDDTEHTLTLFSPSHNDLHWIGRRAENRTDFGHVADSVQDIDGIGIPDDQHKGVAGAQRLGVPYGGITKGLIVPFRPRQARSRALVER